MCGQESRPDPVSPSEVRVGDTVEIEADDGSWMVRARVGDTDDPSHDGPPYPEDSPFGVKLDRFYWWPKLADATVRILHRPEPEPDEAAVEALAPRIYDSMVRLSGDDYVDWEDADTDIRGLYLDEARTLIRDHGVQVVSTDE